MVNGTKTMGLDGCGKKIVAKLESFTSDFRVKILDLNLKSAIRNLKLPSSFPTCGKF